MNIINGVNYNHEFTNHAKRIKCIREVNIPEKLRKPKRDSHQEKHNQEKHDQKKEQFNQLLKKSLIHEEVPIDVVKNIDIVDEEERLKGEYQKVIDVYLRSLQEYQSYIHHEDSKEYTYAKSSQRK